MNATQLPYLVEGILILAAVVFGILVGRKGKPYGKGKLITHLFFFLWYAVGWCYVLASQFTASGSKTTLTPVIVMGVMILIQLVTGISMMAAKKRTLAFRVTRITSATLMFAADIVALIMAV